MIDWSPRARREFAALTDYIRKKSPQSALRIGNRILKRIEDLSVFPDQGTPVGRGLRRLEVTRTPYLVFYTRVGVIVYIVGIVHGRRKRRS